MEVDGVGGRGMGFGLGRGGGICGESVAEDVELDLVDVFVLILRRGGAVSLPLVDVVGTELDGEGVVLGLERLEKDRGTGEDDNVGGTTVSFVVEVGNGEKLSRFVEVSLVLSVAVADDGGKGNDNEDDTSR